MVLIHCFCCLLVFHRSCFAVGVDFSFWLVCSYLSLCGS